MKFSELQNEAQKIYTKLRAESERVRSEKENIRERYSQKTASDMCVLRSILPFSADYEQMLIFEKLVESMEQNAQKAEGREPCRYEQIFGLARRTTERLNECNEIVSLAKELFLYPKAEFGFSPFELSIEDGYMERAGQAKMLEFAEQLYQKEVLE